jgi:hypothetical protein
MRDLVLLAATLHKIRQQGCGVARPLPDCPHGFAWYAGSSRLNGQAMSDLIEDGWLVCATGTDHAIIDAWLSFANEDAGPGHAG